MGTSTLDNDETGTSVLDRLCRNGYFSVRTDYDETGTSALNRLWRNGYSALDRSRLCGHLSTSVSITPPTSTYTHHYPGWVGWGFSRSHASRNSKKHPHPTVTINEITLQKSVPSPPSTTKCTVTVRPTPFSAKRSCLSVRPTTSTAMFVRLPTPSLATCGCLSNSLHCHVKLYVRLSIRPTPSSAKYSCLSV